MDPVGIEMDVQRIGNELAAELRQREQDAKATGLVDLSWYANVYSAYCSLCAAQATVSQLVEMRHPRKGTHQCN